MGLAGSCDAAVAPSSNDNRREIGATVAELAVCCCCTGAVDAPRTSVGHGSRAALQQHLQAITKSAPHHGMHVVDEVDTCRHLLSKMLSGFDRDRLGREWRGQGC